MHNSKPDENSRGTLTAISSTGDGTIVPLWADPTLHALLTTAAGSGVITVGTTVVSGGTTGRVLYDNVGVVGEYTITGTGSTVIMQTSPTLITPTLGVALATSINGNAITTGTGTLSLSTFTVTAAANATISGTNTGDQTNISGNAATVTTNANLTGGVTSVGNAATVVTNANLTGAVTSVGNATSLGSFTSASLSAALTDETGTGANVFANKPTFVGTVNTIVAVAALALDGSLGSIFTKTIGTGSTLTQSNFSTGQCFLVKISGAFTVTWFSGITWVTSGASAPTQAAITTYGLVCTGSNTFDGYLVGTQ